MTTRVEFAPAETGKDAPAPAQAPQGDRPDWLPSNFKTIEDYNASYKELQAELTRTKQGRGLPAGDPDAGAPKDDAEKKQGDGLGIPDGDEPKETNDDDAAKKVVEASGADLAPYQQEFTTTGDVAPESRDAIAKSLESILGPDARTVVDQYIDGRKAAVANEANALKDAVGGSEAYNTMIAWAATALSTEEKQAFNKQINSGDRAAATFAVEALRGRFEKVNGREPRLFKGTFTAPAAGVQKFKSSAEMTAAMKDPRYKTDKAYRDEVAARIP